MKSLIAFCVTHRVTVTMGMVAVALFGVVSWFRMDREFMPALEFPQLVVLTSYSNASSQEVENLVTRPIEEAAGTVKNVQRLHSSSREGVSVVTVEFSWGTNMDVASLNLREKVDLAKAKLPRDAGEPRVEKFNPFALPVLTLSLSGPLEDHALLALARRPVVDILEKSRGVAAITITGGREREIHVEVDQSALAARGLPLSEVAQSISRANITYPAGQVKDATFDYVVRVIGAFDKVEDLGRVALAIDRSRLSSSLSAGEARERKRQAPQDHRGGQAVLLGDVATVQDTFAEAQSYSRYDGRPTVTLSILKQAESNVVRVADDVKRRLVDVRSKLPPEVRLDVVYDQSTFIKDGLRGMVQDALTGGLLAFGVLLVFLGGWRDATTVSLSIPVSLLATLSCMDAKGLGLNTVTLAGLAIGVGNLTDGAIVVQENIARHRAMGKNPEESAIDGAAEVWGPVTSSNLTTVAVFFPLIFVTGLVGQMFGGLSWSVIFSNLTSQIVAFTVIPMLAARQGGSPGKSWVWLARLKEKAVPLGESYGRWLSWALDHPGKTLGYAVAVWALSLSALALLPRTLFPKAEGKEILLRLEAPVGTPLSSTNDLSLSVEKTLKEIPGITHVAVTVGSIPQEGLQPLGPHQAQMVLTLSEGDRPPTGRIVRLIQRAFRRMTQARVYVFERGGTFSFMGGGGAPVVVEVKGTDLEKLESTALALLEKMRGVKGLTNLRTSISERSPELQLEVRRDALAEASLSVTELAETALTAIKGKSVSKFREAGREVDIRLSLQKKDRDTPRAIESLILRSPLDINVPLGVVATVKKGLGPSEILRYDQSRTVLVSADLSGRSVDAVSQDVQRLMDGASTSRDVSFSLTGEAARMKESFRSLMIVLVLSILFVFMIMAAQFESLWEPFLILFAIPLSLIGMAPALWLFGHELSAMAGMGVVLLGGIVVNNGIVLIDFVNQSREEGLPLKEGLREGCHARMRPILMTALTTILGMAPLALGLGEGADVQAPLAVVVVSGLVVSTGLTLWVLPALFVFVDRHVLDPEGRRRWMSRWFPWGPRA